MNLLDAIFLSAISTKYQLVLNSKGIEQIIKRRTQKMKNLAGTSTAAYTVGELSLLSYFLFVGVEFVLACQLYIAFMIFIISADI